MVALVQVLIAAVLIPFAFAAPPVNVNGSDLTTRSFESLSVSPDFRCGAAAGFGCAPGFCCSQHNFCGITQGHCDFGCQPEFSLCDSTRGPDSPRPESSNGRCGSGTVFRMWTRKVLLETWLVWNYDKALWRWLSVGIRFM
ncbi:hypothetical protein BASA61_002364 [Batrachochytrium salamandrivorans]|nr:hypothetical protein BASA61_002364 [Batrachochytrium salamandrivorans]